jgi:hypothetical protein
MVALLILNRKQTNNADITRRWGVVVATQKPLKVNGMSHRVKQGFVSVNQRGKPDE